MTAKKSFLIVLRIILALFLIIYLKETISKWDELSYYMRFSDYLPDLSLMIILWTVIGVIITAVLWLGIYGIFKLIPKSLIPLRLEHIMAFSVLTLLLLFIRRTFFQNTVSFSDLIGLDRSMMLIAGGVLVVTVMWFTRKHVDKIIYGFNDRIAPLVWIFTGFLIFAVPVLIFMDKYPEVEYSHVGSRQISNEWNPERGARPNIILLVMDTLTSRDMQLYGYEFPTTPFISEWAKDAAVFSRLYATSSYTTPGAMSLMTGQRPWTHGVWYYARYSYVKNYPENLPQVLKDNGYNVYGFVQNDHAHPDTLGIGNAFSVSDKAHTFWRPSGWWFDSLKSYLSERPVVQEFIFRNNPIAKSIRAYKPFIDFTLVPADIVYSRFLGFMSQAESEKSPKPFFAYVHVYPPHARYIPPRPYRGTFGNEKIIHSETNPLLAYEPDAQPFVDRMRKRYDDFILYSDKEFEKFMSRLADTIDLSNTIIILTSDHGESFSHGYQSHGGPHLYDPFIHVPLIIKIPGGSNGKIINAPVEGIDIASTILDLIDIPIPEWMEGRSLVPFIEGKPLEPRPVFSMFIQTNSTFGQPITKGTIAVWDGDYKLISYLDNKKKLLFNLKEDPDETRNIAEGEPGIKERLDKLIESNLSIANRKLVQSAENKR